MLLLGFYFFLYLKILFKDFLTVDYLVIPVVLAATEARGT